MKRFRPRLRLALIAVAFSGCQIVPEPSADPTRFFVLEDPAPPAGATDNATGITLGIHTIRLPYYLADSRAIAIATTKNRVEYRDYERWAEPLDAGIERILRSALARTTGISRVLTLPFPAGVKRDYDLQITILNGEGFSSPTGNQIRFALDYSLIDLDGNLIRHGIYNAPPQTWDGQSSDLANLLSHAIVDAADAIAAAIPPP